MTLRSWRADHAASELIVHEPLQWGHDRKVMESVESRGIIEHRVTLQWGHDRKVMERNDEQRRHPQAVGFNGAMTARSWREGPPPKRAHTSEASMGP